MSPDNQILIVSVNQKEVQKFLLRETGSVCDNDGSSTVIPIELTGFQRGSNNIEFGIKKDPAPMIRDNTSISGPFIEWISIVASDTII